MSKPTDRTQRPAQDTLVAQQRRAVLRRIGQASLAAGAASPLTALAGGYDPYKASKRKWCKPSTTKHHASISGCVSVMMSAHDDDKCYGHPPTHHNGKAYCTTVRFKDVFPCTAKTDHYGRNLTSPNCLFHKTISDLCSTADYVVGTNNYGRHCDTREAHWASAYCNSLAASSSLNFPYPTATVVSHFDTDCTVNSAAYKFYKNYMESGPV